MYSVVWMFVNNTGCCVCVLPSISSASACICVYKNMLNGIQIWFKSTCSSEATCFIKNDISTVNLVLCNYVYQTFSFIKLCRNHAVNIIKL